MAEITRKYTTQNPRRSLRLKARAATQPMLADSQESIMADSQDSIMTDSEDSIVTSSEDATMADYEDPIVADSHNDPSEPSSMLATNTPAPARKSTARIPWPQEMFPEPGPVGRPIAIGCSGKTAEMLLDVPKTSLWRISASILIDEAQSLQQDIKRLWRHSSAYFILHSEPIDKEKGYIFGNAFPEVDFHLTNEVTLTNPVQFCILVDEGMNWRIVDHSADGIVVDGVLLSSKTPEQKLHLAQHQGPVHWSYHDTPPQQQASPEQQQASPEQQQASPEQQQAFPEQQQGPVHSGYRASLRLDTSRPIKVEVGPLVLDIYIFADPKEHLANMEPQEYEPPYKYEDLPPLDTLLTLDSIKTHVFFLDKKSDKRIITSPSTHPRELAAFKRSWQTLLDDTTSSEDRLWAHCFLADITKEAEAYAIEKPRLDKERRERYKAFRAQPPGLFPLGPPGAGNIGPPMFKPKYEDKPRRVLGSMVTKSWERLIDAVYARARRPDAVIEAEVGTDQEQVFFKQEDFHHDSDYE